VATERSALVVVAGQDEERQVERGQQLARQLVLGVGRVLGEVARQQDRRQRLGQSLGGR